ncbi:hypothetical protein [Gracilimonas sp.]|uniref:hypothetical protein n=1 Tax=Gracilimonas sp. TaxID=1974203 RepID=UPI003D13AB6E
MKTDDTTITSTETRIFLKGKQLAEVLGVTSPTLSEAVKKGYNCMGYPVGDWAIETNSGRVKGFEVPQHILSKKPDTTKRENPTESHPNLANFGLKKAKKTQKDRPNIVNHNYSLLPEGEDYVRPVSMVTLPLILQKALESDTPQSRAIIAGGLAAMGALVGHAVTDNASGAGLGAGAGLAIALLTYKYFNPTMNPQFQGFNFNQFAKQKSVAVQASMPNQSGFLPN